MMTRKKIFLWLLIALFPLPSYSKIPFTTFEEIDSVHKLIGYHYKSVLVPRLFANKIPPEIKTIHGGKRVRFFIKTILPLILLENEKIENERESVLQIASKNSWNEEEQQIIYKTAFKYRIIKKSTDISKISKDEIEKIRYFLDHRIRPVPVPIALGMAALESGWGSSRFALEANNIFGHTTQDMSKGLKPNNWKGTERHIKKFDTLSDSIATYLLNINRNKAYMKFRKLRREYPDNYIMLSTGFAKYSRIEHEYIERLQLIIAKFGLDRYFEAAFDNSDKIKFIEKINQPYIN